MSGEAMGWALKHRTGNGHVSHVLLRLAMRADEVGAMTLVNADYLVDVCEVSRATVFRALGKLRDLGLLETETSFSRAGGRSVSVRLILDSPTVRADMQDLHGDEGEAEAAADAASLTVRLAEEGAPVSQCDDHSLTVRLASLLEENKYNTPPTPPSVEAEAKASEEERLDAWMVKFQGIYPFDSMMRVSEARREVEQLSDHDRARALRWAAVYAADLKHRGSTRPLDAAKWLRIRQFDEIERLETAKANARGRERPNVFVVKGTPAWAAWIAHGHKPGLDSSRHAGKAGWWFPTLYPPGHDPPCEAEAM